MFKKQVTEHILMLTDTQEVWYSDISDGSTMILNHIAYHEIKLCLVMCIYITKYLVQRGTSLYFGVLSNTIALFYLFLLSSHTHNELCKYGKYYVVNSMYIYV